MECVLDWSSLLRGSLESYQRIVIDINKSKLRLKRAEIAMEQAINDDSISEDKAAQKFIATQVLSARITNKESEKGRIYKELEQSVHAAGTELNNCVREAFFKQRQLIMDSVMGCIQPTDLFSRFDLENILDNDKRVEAIRLLELPAFTPQIKETFTQDGVAQMTTSDGVVDVTTDRNIKTSHNVDTEHTLRVAELILGNFNGLENLTNEHRTD